MAFVIGGGNPLARRYEARLTREAMVFTAFMVVVLLGSLLGHSNMLMLVFALMAGAFILNGQATMSVIRNTRARRFTPEMMFAGEPSAVRIELENRKRWWASWIVLVEDHLRLGPDELTPVVLFQRVSARSSREASYTLIPGRRGTLEFLRLRISSRFPLGLWERGFELQVAERLLVFPRIGRLTPRFREFRRARQRSQFDAPARTGVFDEEFHRLREFRIGDSRRAIHWRTTARRNELMVREYQEQHESELLLLLELWLPEKPDGASFRLVELAVSFVATCCVSRARATNDTGVQLIVCGRELLLLLGESGMGTTLRGALESLAVVEGSTTPEWGSTADVVGCRGGDSVRRLFVSTHPNPRERLTERLAGMEGVVVEQFEIVGGAESPLSEWIELEPAQEASV